MTGSLLVSKCLHLFSEKIVTSMLPGRNEMSPAHNPPVLYQKVMVLRDVPNENLRKGDRVLNIHELP